MKRKGVVLFMTVALIALLIPLIWQSMSFFTESLKQGKRDQFFVTKSLILQDITKALQKRAKDVKKSDDLDNFFMTLPPIFAPKNSLHVNITVEPVLDKVNLNQLYYKKKQDAYITTFVNNLSVNYQLRNSTFLLNLFLDTIDEDEEERDAFSEIVLTDENFRNGAIFSLNHLKLIEDVYYEQTRDKTIYNIPWEDFIYFGKVDSKYILDCERVSSKLLEYLGFEGDLSDGCSLDNTTRNNALKSSLMLESFTKGKEYLAKCLVDIETDEEMQSFELFYNVSKNQIVSMKRVWK